MVSDDNRLRKRSNADEKRALEGRVAQKFRATIWRKAQKGTDPNDRRYDRDIEKSIKCMKPDELDRLFARRRIERHAVLNI